MDRTLLPEPRAVGTHGFHVVEDDLHGGRDGHGEDEAHGAPEPSPHEQRKRNRQRIELHAPAYDFGIEDVEGEDVQAEHGEDDGNNVAAVDLAETGDDGRDEREDHAEVRDQAEKTADESDKERIRE